MNFPANRWLLERLVEWQREGLISDSSAKVLRERYAPDASGRDVPNGIASMVLGVLGALLIGSGLIAIIGYNWDEFSRPVRLLFAFAPLLLAQAYCASLLIRRNPVAGWKREAAAILQTAGAGACIILVSQIYHLSGKWTDFLLCWLLVSLPLAWTHRSKAVAFFCLTATSVWSVGRVGEAEEWYSGPLLYPLLFLGIPQLWESLRSPLTVSLFLRWAIASSAMFGFGSAIAELLKNEGSDIRGGVLYLSWTFLAAGFCLIPLRKEEVNVPIVFKPQVALGGLWILVFGLAASVRTNGSFMVQGVREAFSMIAARVLFIMVGGLALVAYRQKRWGILILTSVVLLPVVAYGVTPENARVAGDLLPIISTVYLGLVGLGLILLDFAGKPAAPRIGAALISILILIRMADSKLSLLTKGLVFIAVGVAFLVFNHFINRRHTGVHKRVSDGEGLL
ncbi:MAG: putative membrane protein [Verrucomicrobia bacterium]|nr:MAG: putative membrane protein [Verrucomicrobiota bacterium]